MSSIFLLTFAVCFHTFPLNWDFLWTQIVASNENLDASCLNYKWCAYCAIRSLNNTRLYSKRASSSTRNDSKEKTLLRSLIALTWKNLRRVWIIYVVNRLERDLLAAALLMFSVPLNLVFSTFLSLIKN